MKRTHTLDEINEKLTGEKVTLTGWVDTIREHGNVAFIDLRDRYGKVQCVITKKAEGFELAKGLTVESCIQIEGEVKERPSGSENKELPSGKVELFIEKLNVFSKAAPLPFEIGREDVNEEIKLKYRYLDMRSEELKNGLILRHKIIDFIRNYLNDEKFLEITTPILTKSSPEGARDYIVPSRKFPGEFYALPQSPQQYKQLLMVGGIDKYFQIAPCFRDEDARAHRCPGEFYQLDMEMSFIDQEDILNLTEDMFLKLVKELFPGKKLTFGDKFKRLTYDEAMKEYGTDKPDLRKNKDDPNELAFTWIIDFPLFEEEKAEGNYAPMHHMFTQPKEGDLDKLNAENAHDVKSYQHDLVLNGFEVGGGSVRIHDPEVQKKVFELIGFKKEQMKYFEHMLTAFSFGVPPHGGIAPGIDRLIMALVGAENIREVIAFPKNGEARDVLMDAPSPIDKRQLKDVHIKEDLPKEKKK
jgi:aspartyl-tRNA synthetase